MLKKLLWPLAALYRLWFYICIFIAIVVVLPFITVLALRKEWYPKFFLFARIWAYIVLILMGFIPIIKGRKNLPRGTTYITVANHTSMIDIMMTLAAVPDCFLFIGKKELAKFPLFGYFYKRTNLLVDRKSLSSRKRVYHMAAGELAKGVGVAIYPEGGIPEASYRLAPFKAGAFKLAVESKSSIVPIVFFDNKRKMPDWHLGGYPGLLRAKILEPIQAEGQEEDHIKELCYQKMLNELNHWQDA